MLKFKFYLLCFFIINAVSCIKSNVSNIQDHNCKAAFVIDEVTGSLSISDETALPEKFTLQLHACIRSYGKIETKLPNTHWVISTHKTKLNFLDSHNKSKKIIPLSTNLDNKKNTIIQMTTDGNGCISWTEEYNYAYSSKSQWIILDRYIKGISNEYPGMCKIPLAVNPWLQLKKYSNIQIADYRKKYHKNNNNLKNRVKSHGLSFLKKQKQKEIKNKVNIIVDELTLYADGSDSKNDMRILRGNIIKAKLKYSIKDIHGNLRENQLNHGDFDIRTSLLINEKSPEGKKQRYLKLNKLIQKDNLIGTNFEETMLASLSFDWIIPYESYNSRIAMYLKIIPKNNTAKRINIFEGIYFIGEDFSSIVSGNKKQLQLNPILSEKYRDNLLNSSSFKTKSVKIKSLQTSDDFSKYISTNECLKAIPYQKQSIELCISNKKIQESMNGFGKAGWTIDKMNLRFFQMVKENWLSRTIDTIVETSISDPLQKKKVSNHAIDIEITDLSTGEIEKIQKVTELNGSISFNISTTQRWYKRQRYFLKIIKFTTQTKELKIEKIIALNPWDYGFTHGFEVNHLTNIRTTCLKKEDKNNMSNLFLKKPINTLTEKQLTTIHKLFCYDSTKKINTSLTEKAKWNNIFNTFKNTLKIILRKPNITSDDHFYKKFTSTKYVKKPTAQIHLFRSINKYPTYLLDDSLNRELYYNLRFKLTPRITRHDDIARGQQNKGPLRDGVYIFQMAVLKNDQSRKHGYKSMVQPTRSFSYYNKKSSLAGTIPLFSCDINSPDCVTIEDFIVPPNNIPVVIRDGKMKTDINALIKREHLLFANAKNILIFRILPADPKTIVCKNKNTDCTKNESNYENNYEIAFDWKQTIKNIKPASSYYHDMFFYTYQTPFIPSEWVNWNITHESNLQFSDIQNLYSDLYNKESVKVSDMLNLQKQVFNHKQVQKRAQNNTSLDKAPSGLNTLKKNSTKNTITPIALDSKLNPDPDYGTFSSIPKDHDYCSSAVINKTNYPVTSDNTKRCSVKPTAHNLLQKHILQFASNNTLCLLDINSHNSHDPLISKSCGSFSSPKNAQNTFLKDLNKQIKNINEIKTEISNISKNKFFGLLEHFVPTKENTEFKIEDSYRTLKTNSYSFKEKLANMPTLPALTNTDLENIIKSDINKKSIYNIKTGTFLYSLCGFWFKDFLSSKYTTADLLLDGFRNNTKKTFYYKLRGLVPTPTSKLQPFIFNINKDLEELYKQYNLHLKQNNLYGVIDDVHKWVNNKPGYEFDSVFHQDLYKKFDAITKKIIFNHKYPRWAYSKNISHPLFTNTKRVVPTNNKHFNATIFLKEATDIKSEPHEDSYLVQTDQHPFRKCINNPSHFFGFEKKIIIGKINDNLKYGNQDASGGEQTTLTVAENFLMNTQRDQGSNQGLETTIGSTLNLLTIPISFLLGAGAVKLFTKSLGLMQKLTAATTLVSLSALAGNAKFSYRSYEGTGNRKLLSIHVGEGISLIAEHTPMRIPLKEYKQCLVIRPRFSAFESHTQKYQHIWGLKNKMIQSIYKKIGLLLCAKGTQPDYSIQEDFYYIYPDYPINGVTIDPSNPRNKPFTILLRGKKEYKKFIHNLSCYVSENKNQLKDNKSCRSTKGNYEYIFSKYIEFADNLKQGFNTPKMFHLTGNSPGIYSPYIHEENKDITSNTTSLQKIFNWVNDLQFMDTDITKIIKKHQR